MIECNVVIIIIIVFSTIKYDMLEESQKGTVPNAIKPVFLLISVSYHFQLIKGLAITCSLKNVPWSCQSA